MKNIFIERLKQAEKPSKREKYIRKVAMWFVIDIVAIAVAVTLFAEALNSSYHVEITRGDTRNADPKDTPETSAEHMGTDGVIAEEGGAPAPLATIKKVAQEEGVDWKILAALFQKETQWNCSRIGDTHLPKASVGCYQISRIYHPEVTDEQAMDLEWSSRWVSKRLKTKADKWGWDIAVMMHNGSPTNPAVQAYLADIKSIIATL